MPAWLTTLGSVLLCNFVKIRKNNELEQEVRLIDAKPTHANIRNADGREDTISIGELAPCPDCILTIKLYTSDAKLADRKSIIDCQDNAELQLLANSLTSSKPSDVAEITQK